MIQLYVLAQHPPTPEGIVCPVEAESIEQAVAQAEKTLGVSLYCIDENHYTDKARDFRLYSGEQGIEQFGQSLRAGTATPNKTDKIKNLQSLNQFTGGDTHYRHPISRMLYSEGVQFLAENADCYWLLDAIASYQPKLMKIETFAYLQFWELKVNADRSCVLTCIEDSGMKPVVRQEIEYTDFPLPEIKLWVEGGVLILPSEH